MLQDYSSTAPSAPAFRGAENPADRRAHPRIPSADLRVTRVRIANRPARSLVDLSSGGALLELQFQVRPQTRFPVQLDTPLEQVEVPFQLLRCYVTDLDGGITYHAAGAFDIPVNIEDLARRASSPLQRLIGALERLQRGLDRSPTRSRTDAAFDELLAEIIVGLRHGESLDLVTLKVKARLTQAFPSLLIMSSAAMAGNASTSVTCFGLTFVSRYTLSAHDRRFLKSNAQVLSMLEETRRDLHEHQYTAHYPSPIVYNAADWVAARASNHRHRIAS
jgi:hypothetical protein